MMGLRWYLSEGHSEGVCAVVGGVDRGVEVFGYGKNARHGIWSLRGCMP